jgi:hypothetical protein
MALSTGDRASEIVYADDAIDNHRGNETPTGRIYCTVFTHQCEVAERFGLAAMSHATPIIDQSGQPASSELLDCAGLP